MHHLISGLLLQIALPAVARPRDDRGDVPGWVMVTLMTAIVVAALDRVVRRSHGALSEDLAKVLARIRTGEPVGQAFESLEIGRAHV